MLKWLLVALASLLVILVACTPKTAPASLAPAALPAPAPTAPPAQDVPPSPEAAAWEKVVQAARRESGFTVYDAQTYGGEAALAMAKAFTGRYGIKVDYVSGVGADVVERLKVERRMGQMIGSVFASSSAQVFIAKKEGLTAKLADLPELKKKDVWEIHPSTQDPDGHAVIHQSGYLSPWINTKLVRPEETPRRYYDLLDPKWGGKKIVASDPAAASAVYLIFVPLLNAKALDMGFIAALGKQNLRLEISNTRSMEVVNRGEAPIVVNGSTTIGNRFFAEGAPIAPLAMEEGTTVSISLTALTEAAPQPNSARLFVNWLLSAEGQETFSRAKSMRSIRKDVRDYSPVWVTPRRVVVTTRTDTDQIAVMFRDRAFVDLLGRK